MPHNTSPNQKAQELVEQYQKETNLFTGNDERHAREHSRRCALIAVKTIIISCTWKKSTYKQWGLIDVDPETTTEYWMQVKKELESL